MRLKSLLPPWRSRIEHCYIPPACQVHSCNRPPACFCFTAYTFVCGKHQREFCIPDKHITVSVEEGLEWAVKNAENTHRIAVESAQHLKREAQRYRKALRHFKKTKA